MRLSFFLKPSGHSCVFPQLFWDCPGYAQHRLVCFWGNHGVYVYRYMVTGDFSYSSSKNLPMILYTADTSGCRIEPLPLWIDTLRLHQGTSTMGYTVYEYRGMIKWSLVHDSSLGRQSGIVRMKWVANSTTPMKVLVRCYSSLAFTLFCVTMHTCRGFWRICKYGACTRWGSFSIV